ncbi:conserved hypothetical protein [Uncinocarpus reesii 1704]|uniref:EDC4-like protein pdc1 beta-propeller domain-containing protein n=1 Tax=Uncinocarpus reesii (strain UAMH 1704) TaxID=336963 RepID=C4JQ17_UNCRE|nr:uncharacterized protein UREG_03250 [Uncinocarpus reesii 1704]EEP78404.1 conserved hypothetical protein [Uncinocarpus reesii 1704]
MSHTPPELRALFDSLMSNPPPGGLSHAFSSANKQQQQQAGAHSSSPGLTHQHPRYAPPSVSSPLVSPPVAGTPPHHGSDIISPNTFTPRNEPNVSLNSAAGPSSHLLNLFKFGNPESGTNSPRPQQPAGGFLNGNEQGPLNNGKSQNGHNRGISASDLISSFMPKPDTKSAVAADATSASPATQVESAEQMLLRLLNRPKPHENVSPEPTKTAESKPVVPPPVAIERKFSENESIGGRKPSPARTFGTRESRETTPFEPPKPQSPAQGPMFTYLNPFEQLASASTRPLSSQMNKSGPGGAVSGAAVKKGKEPQLKAANGLTRSREDTSSQAEAEATTSQESRHEKKKLKTKETVPEALIGVAEKVEGQVEAALAQAIGEEREPSKSESKGESTPQPSIESATEHKKAADVVPEKLEKEPSDNVPAKPAETKKDKDLIESWENETERIVPVYSFPLKPFVSITWKGVTTDVVRVREDGFMDIARLKKAFDQVDRSLTSADAEYIIYALSKSTGMRIIRQDDGRDRQAFRSYNDRIFNVALCRAGPNPLKGRRRRFWALASAGDDNLFEKDALDTRTLLFPPFPAFDENTSGGQLKTRARPSSRHPEFFAIGRGKSIHVIWPHAALSPKYGVSGSDRKVDTEKFYKERALKISTGKAGKDFAFSDDDTIIVSLDKTGRMRFWDIEEVIDADPEAPKPDIRVPLLTLVTAAPSEKSWPTSVLFIDKLRPYLKMCAMRYMLLGFRQNHTLQLWDLGLGKAVQELNFPHEKESDAICSVAYHPGSGIIVVGHPTRNSIYFIHLSAPRYTLPPMSQKAYIQGVVDKDENLFGPQSTACMSGIRELSFGARGQLRSLELLPLGKSSSQRGIEDDAGLFELYVMHSRGVTCLNIKKADLGWSMDNKVIQHVDALEKNLIELKDLRTLPSPVDEQSVNGEGSSSAVGNNKDSTKKSEIVAEKTSETPSSRSESPIKEGKKKSILQQEPGPVEKVEKKKKKKGAADNVAQAKELVEPQKSVADKGEIQASQQNDASAKDAEQAQVDQPLVEKPKVVKTSPPESISTGDLAKGISDVKDALSAEFSKRLSNELGDLYNRFNDDRRAQDELSISRQDAMLRLVSSTLSENVEKNLARIISGNIESTVVPTIKSVITASLEKRVTEELDKNIRAAVPQSISSVLPEAITRELQSPNTLKSISDLVAPAVVKSVESELANVVRNKIMPTIKNEYTRTTEKLIGDVEHMFASKLSQYENQRITDGVKIEQLTTQVSSLVQVISTMAASQTKFQDEILEMNRRFEEMQVAAQEQRSSASALGREDHPGPELSPEVLELREISQLMEEGNYEEASVKWLQSTQQAEIFDKLFVNYNSDYLTTLPPLLSLSVSAAVTSSLKTNVMARLDWLKRVFQTVNVRDPDISQVVPKIMDILIQRLQELYMSVARDSPHDPIIPKIAPLTRWARDLKESSYGQA